MERTYGWYRVPIREWGRSGAVGGAGVAFGDGRPDRSGIFRRPGDLHDAQCMAVRVIESGEVMPTRSMIVNKAETRPVHVEATIIPVRAPDGRFSAVALTVRWHRSAKHEDDKNGA